MQLVLSVVVIFAVFLACVALVQWLIRHAARNAPPENEAARVRRTLENGARTLGGSDYLRAYPPLEEQNPPKRDD